MTTVWAGGMGPLNGRVELPTSERKPHFTYWQERGLSTLAANCLARYGITEDELRQLTDAQLFRIPNFGRKSLNAINALGLRPRGEGRSGAARDHAKALVDEWGNVGGHNLNHADMPQEVDFAQWLIETGRIR